RSLLFKLPGIATLWIASKFLRDSSSFQVVLPGESGCRRKGVPAPWQAIHRAWPGRLARKMGCTLVLKNSKLSDPDAAAGEPGCWLSNPASTRAQDAIIVCTETS